jgi:hypothetical protein
MNNRAAAQDGIGMQRATPETYRRLNEATQLIMHASKSGQVGADAGQFFKPLNPGFNPAATGGGPIHAEGGVSRPAAKDSSMMIRSGGQVSAGAIPLNLPKPALTHAPFDGSGMGVPQTDA